MAEKKMVGVRFLPALMVVALVCVVVALGLLAFAGRDTGGDDEHARDERAARAVAEVAVASQRCTERHAGRVQCVVRIAHPLFDARCFARSRRAGLRRHDGPAQTKPGDPERTGSHRRRAEVLHRSARAGATAVTEPRQCRQCARLARHRRHDPSPGTFRADRAASAAGRRSARRRHRRCDRDRASSRGRQRLYGSGRRRARR